MRRTTETVFDTERAQNPRPRWRDGRGQPIAKLRPNSDSEASLPDKHLHPLGEVRVAYSVDEAASLIGIGRTLAWSLVRSGELPSIRVAGRVLIRRRQLLEWLDTEPQTVYPSAL